MPDDRLLTAKQVADRLQTSEATVRIWLRDGKLRGYRPGGDRIGWRVRESDLEAFIEASGNQPQEA